MYILFVFIAATVTVNEIQLDDRRTNKRANIRALVSFCLGTIAYGIQKLSIYIFNVRVVRAIQNKIFS